MYLFETVYPKLAAVQVCCQNCSLKPWIPPGAPLCSFKISIASIPSPASFSKSSKWTPNLKGTCPPKKNKTNKQI